MDSALSPDVARRLAPLLALAIAATACDRARPIAASLVPECERCHGGSGSAAPPRSATGLTDTSLRAVGAHRRHLEAGRVRAALPCETCHVVPTRSVDGHLDGVARVRFLDPSAAGGAGARWDPETGRCEDVYCHGATLRDGTRGTATSPAWTLVDGSQTTCGSCHRAPPASHAGYPASTACHLCHPGTVRADGTIDVAGMKHIDGRVDAAGGGCTACHGAPPDTGVHRVHANPPDPAAVAYGGLTILEDVSPSGGPKYDFGCGHCHPLDLERHGAAWPAAQVELAPPTTPVPGDDVKARNDPAAAFDATAKTCSGVYCHSSGQETPAYVVTPAWTATPGALGCGGCHGNPPRYASGGPGAATANSHLVLADDGFESGHFHGLPGPWHGSKHGGAFIAAEDAAPITCETCHAQTVDPAARGPSGFYWLDTTGDYLLPGGLAASSPPYGPTLQCTACHDGTNAPVGRGRVLPLRHVNGKREVAFDPRTSLPAIAWLPAAPGTPTRPYWVTSASFGLTLPDPRIPDAIMEDTTLSLHLSSARYDVASKACSNVACHLAQTEVIWGAPHGWSACTACHPF